jgi:hypothetical protein
VNLFLRWFRARPARPEPKTYAAVEFDETEFERMLGKKGAANFLLWLDVARRRVFDRIKAEAWLDKQ